jgi:hypothetical protein
MRTNRTGHPGHAVFKRLGFILIVLVSGACRLLSPDGALTPPAAPAPAATLLPVAVVTATAAVSPTLAPSPALPTAIPPTVAPAIIPPTTAPPIQFTAVPARPTNPSVVPTHPDTLRLKMFLIAMGDNGQSGQVVGCGDSLIPVNIDVPYTQGVLRAALERLLATKEQFYGQSGLYNALYQSNLRIDELKIQDGEAIVQLSGQAVLGGECDTPRLIAQIEATAMQFSTVQRVSVFLNGEPIRTALSLR